jgi:hypothetical protein
MSEIRERASRDTRSNFKFPSNSDLISHDLLAGWLAEP